MNKLAQRTLAGMLLWSFFGILCFIWFLGSPNETMSIYQTRSRSNPFMRSIIINRLILWTMVGLVIAVGVFMWPDWWAMSKISLFRMIIWFGFIIWIIIDLVLTKVYWEWKKLLN